MTIAARQYIDDLAGVSFSRGYLKEMLNKIAEATAHLLKADACALLLLDESRQTLFLQASVGLNKMPMEAVRIPHGKGIGWRIIRERKVEAIIDARDDNDFFFIPELGEERFSSMLAAPIMYENDCMGVLNTQTLSKREYSAEEIKLLEEIAMQVAGSVRTVWYLDQAHNRARVLKDLNTFTQVISDSDEPESILGAVAAYAGQLTGAKTQMIWLADENGALTKTYSSTGHIDADKADLIRERIIEPVLKEKVTLKIDDIESDENFSGLLDIFNRSTLCQPMIFGDRAVGVICVADRRSPDGEYYYAFSGDEAQSLLAIAQISAHALVRASTHVSLATALEENRQSARELSILFQLSLAMQRALDLDELMKVILSCVTVGEGLGFNRAGLFLVDKGRNTINGALGVGPSTGEEAGKIWDKLGADLRGSTSLVEWLISRDLEELTDSGFHRNIQTFVQSLDSQCILARAAKEKQPFNVKGLDDLSDCDTPLIDVLDNHSFAVVPLVAHDEVLGVILVDNFFNKKKITDEDIRFLTRFAAPAAGAIGNVTFLERLSSSNSQLISLERKMAQVERLSTLGEVYAELAHELKNPLVTIGGFARRLAKGKSMEETERYASIIVAEVGRLEKLLGDALNISSDGIKTSLMKTDINSLVEETLDLYWFLITDSGIEITLEKDPNPTVIDADAAQIKQVIINLLLNAIESLSCNSHVNLSKKLFVTTKTDKSNDVVRITIGDTGGGISSRDVAQVFTPFFTTKQGGTGLGLPLCKRIVRGHHGFIEIDNKLGVGVSFTITLPIGA